MGEDLTNTDFEWCLQRKMEVCDRAPERCKAGITVCSLRDRSWLQCGQAHYALYLLPHGEGGLILQQLGQTVLWVQGTDAIVT